ncbi:MAG: hypothetical protein WCI31_03095 [Prolixibacteraceae bacterium]
MKFFQKLIRIVPATLFLLCFLVMQHVFGQGKADMNDYLSQRFQRYCELFPREEVFVSSDQEEYIAGEELWFNIWSVDKRSSSPSSNSKIIYLELLNPENNPISQKRISIVKGSGQGYIELPDTLTTGTYTIRAYTNWMKNFLPFNCFMKDIKIYNPFRSRFSKNKIIAENGFNPEISKNNSFFNSNQLLTLKVNNLRPDTLEIFVNAAGKYLSDNNNLFYLFIQTHGKTNLVSSERINDEHTKIGIPKNLLIPGINQITLFNFKGQPVCERYIYTPDKRNNLLSIHVADSCRTRSKVSLELNIEDSRTINTNSTNLSLSVSPVTNRKGNIGFSEYMIFGSEFGLLPERIIKGKKINELPRELMDSLLLNIKSNWIDWKSVLSDTLPEFKFKVEREDHFLTGMLFTSNHQLAPPGEFLILSTPGKIPKFQYAKTNKEAKFTFNIHVGEEVQDLIIQPDDVSKNYGIYLESSFSDKYLASELRVDSIRKPMPSYLSKMGINYQVGKIYGFSSVGIPFLTPYLPTANSKRFYGKPDEEIILKDWVKLSSMEEVFFEIVPQVKLKKNGSIYEMLLVDPFGKILYDTPPVIMIDGVIIKDPGIIANLDPENVEKIDIVKKRYIVGDYLFNGIVNVITSSGDFSNVAVAQNAINFQYQVIDSVHTFKSSDYSSLEMNNRHEPDFRNTLYWNPSLKSEKDGKAKVEFWTSDITGDYEVKVQGITSEGKIFTAYKIINVKY